MDEGTEETACSSAVIEDAQRDHRFFRDLPFEEDKCCVEREAEDQGDEDRRGAPGVKRPSGRDANEECTGSAAEDEDSHVVHAG